MYKSLSSYINFLEEKGELIRIKEFTDPVFEITKRTDIESKKPEGGKALLFENTGTAFPVVTNIMGSEKRIQYALGMIDEPSSEKCWKKLSEKIDSLLSLVSQERPTFMDKLKVLPSLASISKWLPKEHSGKAPCQEIKLNSIKELPVLKCWPQDGGHFITLPMVHTKDPETGSRNVGMYRMQVFSDTSTGMHWHRHKTGARHYDNWKEGKMPVVVTLGGDPSYTFSATAPLPDGIDEYLLAGFLRNKPVSLVKCLTQPIKVPADCDFVIEGYVDPKEPKVVEGPFGDHTGFYSLADLYPTFHITCITARKDAIYPATIVGVPPMEDKYIALATEKIFLSPMKFAIAPEVLDFTLPEEGVQHNFAVVQINKSYPGQAQKVANALWGCGQMMFNKFILIVGKKACEEDSEDLNIHDRAALRRAIELNYHPQRDSYFTKGPLDILDHCAPVCGYGGKLCVDATIKLPEENAYSDISACGNNKNIDNESSSKLEKNHYIFKNLIPGIEIITDKKEDKYHTLWLLGANCDPIRDSHLENDTLILDARSKKNLPGFTREWPDVAEF